MPKNRPKVDYAQLTELPVLHSATIGEDFLDAMNHMNVMWYTHLFSEGMASLQAQVGLSWQELEAVNGGTFALEAHVRYLSEVRVGQTIDLRARVIARSARRYHVLQFMTNRDKQEVAATNEMIGAYVDLGKRRMANLPDSVRVKLDALIEQHHELAWEPPVCQSMAP